MLQSELLAASEAAKATQRHDLEGHLRSAQGALKTKTEEAAAGQERLAELTSQLELEKKTKSEFEASRAQLGTEVAALKEQVAERDQKAQEQVSLFFAIKKESRF